MSITIGPYTFPIADYDAEGDVLELRTVVPDGAVGFDSTDEGDGLRFDEDGHLVGITILDARWRVQHDGRVTITLPVPEQINVGADALHFVLLAA